METVQNSIQRIPDLESHLGYVLRRVSNVVSAAFARALGEEKTSVAEWVILRELHQRGQAAPGELADQLGMSRGAVSKIIDKLQAKDWVRLDATECDKRCRLLSITRAGRRSLPVLAEIADRNDMAYFDCPNAKEKASLRKLLTKVAEHHRIHDIPTD